MRGEDWCWSCLTKQKFLLEKEFLEQQFLEDFLVVSWVEVVNWVSEDGLINWDSGNKGDSQEDEQYLWKVKRKISKFRKLNQIIFKFNSRDHDQWHVCRVTVDNEGSFVHAELSG